MASRQALLGFFSAAAAANHQAKTKARRVLKLGLVNMVRARSAGVAIVASPSTSSPGA